MSKLSIKTLNCTQKIYCAKNDYKSEKKGEIYYSMKGGTHTLRSVHCVYVVYIPEISWGATNAPQITLLCFVFLLKRHCDAAVLPVALVFFTCF